MNANAYKNERKRLWYEIMGASGKLSDKADRINANLYFDAIIPRNID